MKRMNFSAMISIFILGNISLLGATVSWNGGTSSNWNTATNWTPNTVPNAAGDVANFPLVANTTVVQDIAAGAQFGIINFNSTTSYSLSGNQLIGSNSGSNAQINVQNVIGAHAVSTPFLLAPSSLTITQNSTGLLTLSGAMSGAGSLTFNGPQTLVLSGANTFTGGMNIGGGIVQVGGDGNLGAAGGSLSFVGGGGTLHTTGSFTSSRPVVIGAPATFDINPAVTTTLSGNLTGSSTLTKIDTGTLILTGSNSGFTGNMVVSAGVLQGNSSSLVGNIANSASLIFDQAATGSYAGNISGAGSVTKQNSGKLTFTGTNASNTLSILAGNLAVNGSYTAPGGITVSNGATLSGLGTLTGNLLVNGTLSPGNSIGTETVNGNVTFGSGSTYSVEFQQSASDLLVVNGSVTIQPNSTLLITPLSGPSSAFTTNIIQTTGGVAGTFSTVSLSNTFPLLQVSVLYDPLNVMLQVGFLPFTSLVNTGNPGKVAAYLDLQSPAPGSDLALVISDLRDATTTAQLREELNELQPSLFSAFALAEENMTREVRATVSSRLNNIYFTDCCGEIITDRCGGLWMGIVGDYYSQKKTDDQFSFAASSVGGVIGLDAEWDRRYTLGAVGGYTFTHINWENPFDAGGRTNSFYGGLYGAGCFSYCLVDASFIGAYTSSCADREIEFLDRLARHHHNGVMWDAHAGLCTPLCLKKVNFVPFVMADYMDFHENSFSESGAQSVNLIVDAREANLLRAEGGVRLSCCFDEYKGRLMYVFTRCHTTCPDSRYANIPPPAFKVVPAISASMVQEWRFSGDNFTSQMEGAVGSFTVTGLNPNRTLFSPAAEITVISNWDPFSATLRWEGEYGCGINDNNLFVKLDYDF